MGRSIEQTDSFLKEAIDNIRNDRAITSTLLADLLTEIKKDINHKDLGLVAAKYVETLQRSNEQLVKVVSIIEKKKSFSEEITESDRAELFDLIQGTKE